MAAGAEGPNEMTSARRQTGPWYPPELTAAEREGQERLRKQWPKGRGKQ
jgi:hypothetical protein